MKNPMRNISLLAFICSAFLMTSCASKEAGEKTANEFYEALKAKDYETAFDLIDQDLFDQEGEEVIKSFITQKEVLGELKSFTQESGFKVMEQNGKSMVRLLYTTEYANKTLYEYIVLGKSEGEYKIVSYAYYDSKEKRDEYQKYNEE